MKLLAIVLCSLLFIGCPASEEQLEKKPRIGDIQCYSMGVKIVDEQNVQILSQSSNYLVFTKNGKKTTVTEKCVVTEK